VRASWRQSRGSASSCRKRGNSCWEVGVPDSVTLCLSCKEQIEPGAVRCVACEFAFTGRGGQRGRGETPTAKCRSPRSFRGLAQVASARVAMGRSSRSSMDKWLAREATELPVIERGAVYSPSARSLVYSVDQPNTSAASSVASGWLQLPVPYSFPQNAILQNVAIRNVITLQDGRPNRRWT
jgi:hypothetical protein